MNWFCAERLEQRRQIWKTLINKSTVFKDSLDIRHELKKRSGDQVDCDTMHTSLHKPNINPTVNNACQHSFLHTLCQQCCKPCFILSHLILTAITPPLLRIKLRHRRLGNLPTFTQLTNGRHKFDNWTVQLQSEDNDYFLILISGSFEKLPCLFV